MKIGLIKEIKDKENRVGMTPEGVRYLARNGHEVRVEKGAGLGSGFADDDYAQAGAELVATQKAWDSDLVVKVKEPLEAEYPYLRDQIVFTYFHLAGVTPTLTETLLERQTTAIAYETVEDGSGKLLLAPMSGVAGNMAVTMGGYYLAKPNNGKGMLLGDVLGHAYGRVAVIGDGVVGRHAARAAAGMGAEVIIFGRHPEREATLQRDISPVIRYLRSEPEGIAQQLREADLVVVVDIDPAHCGALSLVELEREHGPLPPTVEATTGGGGRHLYFVHPGGELRNKVGLAAGIDLRGDVGYLESRALSPAVGGRRSYPYRAQHYAAAPKSRYRQGAG